MEEKKAVEQYRISVAMAAYNGERFLREQIDSILAQLLEGDELVISYDESTDSTLEILQEYQKSNKQIKIVFDSGKGVFSNFENAIANTKGDFVFISDQDDKWLPGKRTTVVNDFVNTNADMIIHNGIHIDEKGERITEDFFSLYKIKKNVFRNFLKPRYSGCCTAFRKELKKLILPIPRSVGAYDHWIGMVGELYGNIYFESKVLLEHRIHGNNVTVSTRSLKTIFKARKSLLNELIKVRRSNK